jgi:hypothetical protein
MDYFATYLIINTYLYAFVFVSVNCLWECRLCFTRYDMTRAVVDAPLFSSQYGAHVFHPFRQADRDSRTPDDRISSHFVV